jgi:hypothetical protein
LLFYLPNAVKVHAAGQFAVIRRAFLDAALWFLDEQAPREAPMLQL